MNKREEQKARRRVEILRVGLDLFLRKGYNATKITDIAKEVNMSTGLMFHYFESKEKLYEELIKLGCNGFEFNLYDEDKSALDILNSIAEDILNLLKENHIAAKIFVLMEKAKHSEGIPENLKQLLSQNTLIDELIPIIESGQALGEIREGNSKALSIAFCCSLFGITEELALTPNIPCPEASWIIDILKK